MPPRATVNHDLTSLHTPTARHGSDPAMHSEIDVPHGVDVESMDSFDPFLDEMHSSIGSSDQACKECRRRKARCNRALPTCDLCVKYRRHCLYEKHARTPLTRKHLTEVETRLERAEAQLRRMRTLVPQHLRTWESGNAKHTSVLQEQPDQQPLDFSQAPSQPNGADVTTKTTCPDPTDSAPAVSPADPSMPTKSAESSCSVPRPAEAENQRLLERAPHDDDFEWCELEAVHPTGLSPDGTAVGDIPGEDSPVSDGMASLTVNEKEAGYLGVASGAALLRILEPRAARRRAPSRSAQYPTSAPCSSSAFPRLTSQPNPNRHIAESMIDTYFRLYHVSYPIIHEPTFRAQYSEVIPRPGGACWTVLAYVVAAIGVWTSATSSADTLDMALFAQARSVLGFDFLEMGNITLVQALTLASNYQQKRDKPNSGYNYLGLAVRMAMGLGLHKEFQGWNISPLNMEIRRRVWWSLCVFDVGATITFSRPDVWPYRGVEVSFPLNVNDRELTAASTSYPLESNQITPYTAVATQARFHIATHQCYERVISKPLPSAEELLRLDKECIQTWQANLPTYFSENTSVPEKYAHAHAVMSWRLRNLRIIMYRPFVIRRALRRRADSDEASTEAYSRCLADAKSTIEGISEFWGRHEHNRLTAWYALYFLFQAALIPCICLRNDPSADAAPDWRAQLTSTLQTISAIAPVNASSALSYQIVYDLCGRYLDSPRPQHLGADPLPAASDAAGQLRQEAAAAATPHVTEDSSDGWPAGVQPVGESPQTQVNNVFSMMWPNVPPLEAADVVMGDDAGWMEFLRAGSMEDWAGTGAGAES